MAEKKGPPRSRVQSGPLGQQQPRPRKQAAPSKGGKSSEGAAASKDVEETLASKLSYKEVKGDLFECPPTCSLAHCVSEDMAMGKGVAKLFKEKFGGVSKLKDQGVKTGGVAVLEREGRFLYYLVTKIRHFQKPTYDSLRSSLTHMKEHCRENGVRALALPTIGCGLDKLSWDKVSKMIKSVFSDMEVEITVYCL